MDFVARHIEERVRTALSDTRVVAILGPRQAGKSTLARRITERLGGRYVSLDDALIRRAALDDPQGFVREHSGLLTIDEIQRAPELVLAIKLSVDEDPRPGRFLLTGSTHLLSARDVADSLAGRIEMLDLWPLAAAEIHGLDRTFIDRVLTSDRPDAVDSDLTRADYLDRIRAGGFPEALARTDRRRRDWYQAYLTTVIERESREVVDTDRGGDVIRLLQFVAARHSSLLNVAELSRDAGLAERTAHRYLHLLEAVFLVTRTPPWWANLSNRLTKQPKITIADSGLAAHLRRGSERDPTLLGPLVEGFVLEELRRQLTWSWDRGELFHYRDKQGREVDALIEMDDGRLVGVEVKLSESLAPAAFHGLRHLRDRLPDRFVCGIVLHAGRTTLPHGDRLWSAPIASLWS